MDKRTRCSFNEKFWPIQTRGPLPKGTHAKPELANRTPSPFSENLSGSNLSAFFQTFSLCWMLKISTVSLEPLGMKVPESTVSSVAIRGTT
jgi:hypothetical protein